MTQPSVSPGLRSWWRSLLFVPAINEKFIARAVTAKADAIIIDLEDSVPLDRKAEARTRVRQLAPVLKASGADVLVRINRPLPLAVRDVEAAIGPDVSALMIAKADGADHLRLLTESIAEMEKAQGLTHPTMIVPLIETGDAVLRLADIARAPRVSAIVCGDEDLAAELGCDPACESLVSVKHQLVLAAGAARCQPLGLMGSITDFRDLDRFRAAARRSRAAGLTGTLCIHPAQVPVANEEFGASGQLVAWARRVIARAEEAAREGKVVASIDGTMIDAPVVKRARGILEAQSG